MKIGEFENNIESLAKIDKHISAIEDNLASNRIKNIAFVTLGSTALLGSFVGAVQATINYNQIATNITSPLLLAAFSMVACVYSFNKLVNGMIADTHMFAEKTTSLEQKDEIVKDIERNEILVSTQGPNGNIYKFNHNDIKQRREDMKRTHTTSKGAIQITRRS